MSRMETSADRPTTTARSSSSSSCTTARCCSSSSAAGVLVGVLLSLGVVDGGSLALCNASLSRVGTVRRRRAYGRVAT